MTENVVSLAQVRANRAWAPTPRDLAPEVQAEINQRGRALVQDILDRAGVKPRASRVTTANCPTHPDMPGGLTPAGDPWCGDCRRGSNRGGAA